MRSILLAMVLALYSGPTLADDLLKKGTTAYGQLCSRCHGFHMVNPGTGSFDLRKFPREDKKRFVNSVTNGKNDMPAMGDLLIGDELEALWRYVSTRAGKEPPVEESGSPLEQDKSVVSLDTADLSLMNKAVLTACLPINGGVMSGRRANGGTGLDYEVSTKVAQKLGLKLKVVWYEADLDEETDPITDTYAMLSKPLCDVVPGFALYGPTLGNPKGTKASVPRWKKRRYKDEVTVPEFVDLKPIAGTAPYARIEMGFVLRKAKHIGNFSDLEGLRLGIQEGTLAGAITMARASADLKANAVSSNPGPKFLWDMEKGEFDAALISVSEFDFHKRQNRLTKLKLADYRHPLGFNIGMALLAKNSVLGKAIDVVTNALLAEYTIEKIARETGLHIAPPRKPYIQSALSMRDLLSQ